MVIEAFQTSNHLRRTTVSLAHCCTSIALIVFLLARKCCLGLVQAWAFMYWHQKGVDPFIGGRVNLERPSEEGLERTVSHRLGVKTGSFYTTSTRKAEKTLLGLLESQQPVMLQG